MKFGSTNCLLEECDHPIWKRIKGKICEVLRPYRHAYKFMMQVLYE
jgi:hypothetical protein